MKRAKQKLHSRSGASILLALLLFLVAAMVCAVIVSASLTAAKRVYDDRSEEQEYLAVSSAAKALKEWLLHPNVRKETTRIVTDGVLTSEWTDPKTPGPLDAVLLNVIEHPGVYTLTVDPSGGELGGAVMHDFTVTESDTMGFEFSGMLAAAGGQADSQKIYFSARAFWEPDGTDGSTQEVEVPDGAGGTKIVMQTTEISTKKLTVGNIQFNTVKEAAQ